MKKFLGILAIAGTLVACNNSANSTDNKVDSTDSAAKAQKAAVDTMAKEQKAAIDTNAKATKDSIKGKDTSAHK